ncbi:glycosyltransferase family 4 protein [Corynebacterium casei]|uniref:glycosyltransferase family 4 protein n=1 Tax=Corynebacterium casei TaxID=160386 RepID=UPI003FD6B7F6
MKVLVLSQYWYPENGVPQRRWSWLSRILRDLGHEVVAIAPPPHYEREISVKQWFEEFKNQSSFPTETGPSGEKIARSLFFPAGRSVTQRALNQATVGLGAIWMVARKPKWLKELSPDLIIASVPALPTAFVAYVSSRVLKVPYHIDLRDAWPDLLDESADWNRATGRKSIRERLLTKGPFQVIRAVTRRTVNFSLRHADSIIVTSSFLQEDLETRQELFHNGNPPKISTIRNLFPPETKIVKEESHAENRESGTLNVLYAGTLGRAQNLLNVLEALELARDMGIDIQLRMIGAGASRDALTERIKERQLDVTIEGRKPASELQEAYRWADTALVHLTDWEPLKRAVPSKTYELMSTGIHISGVLDGEAAEIIRKFDAGHVVSPENPVELAEMWRVLAQDRSLLEISDRGARWVKHQEQVEVPAVLAEVIENRRD